MQKLGAGEDKIALGLQLMHEESEAPEQVRQEESHNWQLDELVSVKASGWQTHVAGAVPLRIALGKHAVHEVIRFPTSHVKQVTSQITQFEAFGDGA
jgi:hypothetical protein